MRNYSFTYLLLVKPLIVEPNEPALVKLNDNLLKVS